MTDGKRVAVFLDRDGVINERAAEHDYVRSVADFLIVPGAPAAIKRLSEAGYLPIVVSNQQGIGRGIVTWEVLRQIEDAIQAQLALVGSKIIAFYYCPHLADAGCDCRKPSPGMLTRAADDHALDLQMSIFIGDSESDVEAGRRAGCKTVLVTAEPSNTKADAAALDLPGAAVLVIDGIPTSAALS